MDSFSPSQKIIRQLAKKFEVSLPNIDSKEFKIIWGRGGYQMIKFYFPNCNPKQVHQEWKKLETKMKIQLIAGGEKVIRKLKKREAIIGMVTNRSWSSLKQYPKIIGLEFDFIQTSEYNFKDWLKHYLSSFKNHLATRKLKPNPKQFKLVFKWLKRNKIKAKKVYYIGDTLVDFQTVVKTNTHYNYHIKFIAVLSGPIKTRREWYEITKAKEKFLILRSIADLILWLNNKGNKGDEKSSPFID